jgi:hypothetical protein
MKKWILCGIVALGIGVVVAVGFAVAEKRNCRDYAAWEAALRRQELIRIDGETSRLEAQARADICRIDRRANRRLF